MLSLPMQQFLSYIDSKGDINKAIVDENILLTHLLPSEAVDTMNQDALERYIGPFHNSNKRQPLLQYIKDYPNGSGPSDVVQLISNYSAWLLESNHPKLMYYAVPGFMTPIETVSWVKDNFKNCSLVELPNALHLAQETMPELFSKNLSDWYKAI